MVRRGSRVRVRKRASFRDLTPGRADRILRAFDYDIPPREAADETALAVLHELAHAEYPDFVAYQAFLLTGWNWSPRSTGARGRCGSRRNGTGLHKVGLRWERAALPDAGVMRLLQPSTGVRGSCLDQGLEELAREEEVAEQLAAAT